MYFEYLTTVTRMLPAVTSQEVLHVHATLVSQEMEQLAQVQN